MRLEGIFLSPVVAAVGLSLIHFIWQGIVVAILISGVLAFMDRRGPQARYAVACLGLLIMAALPLA